MNNSKVMEENALDNVGIFANIPPSIRMVDFVEFFSNFTQSECCGKCIPCREGSRRILEILEKINGNNGEQADLEKLERLSRVMITASLCGLGQRVPSSVLSLVRYLQGEYDTPIFYPKLPVFTIMEDKCKGCGLCAKVCPAAAISGEKKKPHTIDVEKCVMCASCIEKCKVGSIAEN